SGTEGHFRVATNDPSALIQGGLPDGIERLATLPMLCQTTGDFWNMRVRRPLFMVGGELGEGRVLVLADHSIFINEMMLPNDNENVEFTIACVRWLRGDTTSKRGRRTKVLFVEEGQVQTKLEIPLKSAIIGPDEMLRLIWANRDMLLVKAEDTLVDLEQ